MAIKKNENMDNSLLSISKALMDLAGAAETVLFATAKGRAAEKNSKLDSTQRSLMDRVDGFRSIEQLLAMSGDLIGVHAALGNLMVSGYVSTTARQEITTPVAASAPVVVAVPVVAKVVVAPAPSPPPAAAKPPVARAKPPAPVKAAVTTSTPAVDPELDNAKRVLAQEAKIVFGNNAAKLQPRIDGCRSIEDIYDLIVKFQQHLANSGKANPDVFLDRLTKGLASARKQAPGAKRPPAAA